MDQQKCILVVDDDDNVRELLQLVLELEGYKVVEAANGASGLKAAMDVKPDLILLDMRMPVMDGWAFARAYAEQQGYKARIVVCSAAPDADERGREIEADGVLSKPFGLHELFSQVERHTR